MYTVHPQLLPQRVATQSERASQRPSVLRSGVVGQRERFERVVASLLKAELDDALWPVAAAHLDDACGMWGNHLAVIRGDRRDNAEFLFGKLYKRGEPDDELERRYVEDYFAIDERFPRFFTMADGQLTHVSDMFTDRERASSPTYNEYLLPTGAGNSLNAHMTGPGGLHIVMSLVSDGVAADWTTERLGMLRRVMPHIRHFVRVRQALADVGAGAVRSAAEALGARRIGIVLLDRRGRIVEANDHAQAMFRADDLTNRGGYLVAPHAADAGRLAGLLAAALGSAPVDAEGATMPVRRPGRPSLVLHVAPLAAGRDTDFAAIGCAVMVLIVDPLDKPRVDPDRLARALDLTPSEARVAATLASGGTVQSIAATSHRSEAVVRWHLKRMTARLGVFGQTDLVRLVLTTPGVFDS